MQEKSQPKSMPRTSNDLKAKITKRWNILTGHQTLYPFQGEKSTAFAQLEYILIEAGLLAERRERRPVKEEPEQSEQPEFGDYADRETEAERNV
jgi:hypothetical protein